MMGYCLFGASYCSAIAAGPFRLWELLPNQRQPATVENHRKLSSSHHHCCYNPNRVGTFSGRAVLSLSATAATRLDKQVVDHYSLTKEVVLRGQLSQLMWCKKKKTEWLSVCRMIFMGCIMRFIGPLICLRFVHSFLFFYFLCGFFNIFSCGLWAFTVMLDLFFSLWDPLYVVSMRVYVGPTFTVEILKSAPERGFVWITSYLHYNYICNFSIFTM